MTSGHARDDDVTAGRARSGEDGPVGSAMHPSFAERRAEVHRAAGRRERTAPATAPGTGGHFDHFHHFDRLRRDGEGARHAADRDTADRDAEPAPYPAAADPLHGDDVEWDPAGPQVPGWHTPVPVPDPADRAVGNATGRDDARPGPPPRPPAGPADDVARPRGGGAHRLLPRPRAGDDRPRAVTDLVDRLTTEGLVRPRPARPEFGWRRALWELSGGRVNPGVGGAGLDRAELVHRVRSPLRGSHRIAVISVKGGVGKTTVSAGLGLTFAELRGDRVLAMDANPDMGTLADRLTGDTAVTVQHLLDHLGAVEATSINDIEQFVSAIGRLHVLAGGQEPCDGQAFTRDEYEEAVAALSRCYNVLITDSGTGVNHSAMEGTIAAADGVVIVGAPTVDAASRASMTLEWLDGIGRGELARQAVVVLSLDRSSRDVDKRTVVDHFAPRCRAVVEIPSDPHLATGGRIDLQACRPATRNAFLVLAAELADAFPAYEW